MSDLDAAIRVAADAIEQAASVMPARPWKRLDTEQWKLIDTEGNEIPIKVRTEWPCSDEKRTVSYLRADVPRPSVRLGTLPDGWTTVGLLQRAGGMSGEPERDDYPDTDAYLEAWCLWRALRREGRLTDMERQAAFEAFEWALARWPNGRPGFRMGERR
jgi:hypothetical protein